MLLLALMTRAVALDDLVVAAVVFAVVVPLAFAPGSAVAAVLAIATWPAAAAAQAVSAKRTALRTLKLKLFIALGLPIFISGRSYLAVWQNREHDGMNR